MQSLGGLNFNFVIYLLSVCVCVHGGVHKYHEPHVEVRGQLLCVSLCVCVHGGVHKCHEPHVEVRGQPLGICFPLPFVALCGPHSGCQAWPPVLFYTPSHLTGPGLLGL